MDFALIGAAGYVAPRHMKAIKDTGNDLVVALDPNDSVGVLDSYFPRCKFFTETERFDRHLEKLRRADNKVDYISVCSPNYLHDAHCRLGMRVGSDVVCEKPLVLNPWNLDQLKEIEEETGQKINVVLQLRLHPELVKLKKELTEKDYMVEIIYVTPRGPWYDVSWKGDVGKSGGIATNIGIHFFDMLMWMFGEVEDYIVTIDKDHYTQGFLRLERAKVYWTLSTDPKGYAKDYKPYRSISINQEQIRFDNVFTDLHTEVYKDILNGGGFGIEDARPSIELVHNLRNYNRSSK